MSKNNSILGFIVGAAIGSIVTWAISKNEYEKRMNEEFQSMRKRNKKDDEVSAENEICEELEKNPDNDMMENAKRIIKEHNYGDVKIDSNNAVPAEKANKNYRPYVIKPTEFGELYDYGRYSLTLYGDGILADEDDNVIDDVEGTVGKESLKTFGQYEEDSVYVRNDERKNDYEVLLDERRYCDIKRPKI